MKKVMVEVFETSDGKVFSDESDAQRHQEMLDAIPDTWPYMITLNMQVQVVWDLAVDPDDPKADEKVEEEVYHILRGTTGSSLRKLGNNELQYGSLIGDIEFDSYEEG